MIEIISEIFHLQYPVKTRYHITNDSVFFIGGEDMDFAADTWWIVTTAATIAVAIISYFLRRTMSKQDENEKDIKHIQLTYVTKTEFKDFKDETSGGISKLQRDIEEIKETGLSKADFYRSQANMERKLDKLYDIILKMGGNQNG